MASRRVRSHDEADVKVETDISALLADAAQQLPSSSRLTAAADGHNRHLYTYKCPYPGCAFVCTRRRPSNVRYHVMRVAHYEQIVRQHRADPCQFLRSRLATHPDGDTLALHRLQYPELHEKTADSPFPLLSVRALWCLNGILLLHHYHTHHCSCMPAQKQLEKAATQLIYCFPNFGAAQDARSLLKSGPRKHLGQAAEVLRTLAPCIASVLPDRCYSILRAIREEAEWMALTNSAPARQTSIPVCAAAPSSSSATPQDIHFTGAPRKRGRGRPRKNAASEATTANSTNATNTTASTSVPFIPQVGLPTGNLAAIEKFLMGPIDDTPDFSFTHPEETTFEWHTLEEGWAEETSEASANARPIGSSAARENGSEGYLPASPTISEVDQKFMDSVLAI